MKSLTFSGTPGSTYTITHPDKSETFGKQPGQVRLNGVRLNTDVWSPHVVSGPLPMNANPGPVILNTGDSAFDVHDSQQFEGGYGTKDLLGVWSLPSPPASGSSSPSSSTSADHADPDRTDTPSGLSLNAVAHKMHHTTYAKLTPAQRAVVAKQVNVKKKDDD